MSSFSVLFVGGGRRLELARLFQNLGFDVYGYEVDELCPLSQVGKIIKGLPWNNTLRGDCYEHLTATIQAGKFDIVLPLMDAAIPILGKINRYETHSSNIIVPPVCFSKYTDKLEFEKFMLEWFPQWYPKPKVSHFVVEKPRFGFGSRGISRISYLMYQCEKDRLDFDNNYVYQKYVKGKEYSVDCYVNRNGVCIGAVPRERIEVIGGEVSKSRTVKFPRLEEASQQIVEHNLDMRGPITVQWIVEDDTNDIYCIEANNRFCGGSPLSIQAGFNTIRMLVEEYIHGRTIVAYRPWRPDVYMTRSFESTYFNL